MKTHLHFMGHAACSAGASNLAYSEEPTCGNCRKILERMRAKLTRQQSAQGAPGKTMYSARRHCPVCGHAATEWRALSGRGTVHSHTLVERAPRPTAPAIVETEEGLRLHTVVMDADVHALRIGDPVTLRFVSLGGGPPLPAFTTPAAEAARAYSTAALAALGEGETTLADA